MSRSSRDIIGIIFVTILIVPAAIVIYFRGSSLYQGKLSRKSENEPIIALSISDSKIKRMNLEQYLIGVVSAEMPASFNREALAAQAVIARTYAVRWLSDKPGTPLSSDYTVCQGWESPEKCRDKWGFLRYIINSRKIREAVSDTRGLIVTYEGYPAETPYHSTSGEFTEDALEVWGKNVPYLKSVECRWCHDAPRYSETKTMTPEELTKALRTIWDSTPTNINIKILSRDGSGRVKTLSAGDRTLKGTDFRKAIGLNSTNFDIQQDAGKLIFTTRGYGHGVGMCQYGANGMANQKKSYQEIISYYYSGTNLSKLY